MTPERAHAQALNEAHDLFGGHDTFLGVWRLKRERWIKAREAQLVATPTETTDTTTTATGVSR